MRFAKSILRSVPVLVAPSNEGRSRDDSSSSVEYLVVHVFFPLFRPWNCQIGAYKNIPTLFEMQGPGCLRSEDGEHFLVFNSEKTLVLVIWFPLTPRIGCTDCYIL